MNVGKPHRFRFSLRTLFVVVTVVCVWLGYGLRWLSQRRAHISMPNIRSGTESYFLKPAPSTPFPLKLFGEKAYSYVILDVVDSKRVNSDDNLVGIEDTRLTTVEREELARIQGLFPEATIYACFFKAIATH